MNLWTGPWAPLLRWPLAVTAVTAVVLLLVAWSVAGLPGLIGAAIGAAATVTFFTITLLLMSWTATLAPHSVMAVALLAYGVKVTLLGILLVALFDSPWLSGMSLAVGVVVCTTVWLAAQLVAARRARIHVFDPT